MRFPNAYEGVKKLFSSEILSLIAGLCLLIATAAGVFAVASVAADSGGGMVGGTIATAIFGLGSGVLYLIAYIFKLIGLKRAGLDEPRFQQAFLLAIFALILSVVAAILSSFNVGNGIVDDIVRLFVTIAEIIITIFVIGGIQTLSVRMGREDMVDKGQRILIIIVIVYILGFIATLIPLFFGSNPATATISGILSIVGTVLNIIAYIVFLVYLGQAKKMLSEEA